MKKPLQRQPFAAFTVLPSGIDGAVRHENGCAKYCTKPRNWKVSAVIRYEDGDVIREDVIDFRATKAMPTDFTAEMYRHLNERIAGRKWYFARVTQAPDQRRYLFGHLMTCRDCVVEQFTFCPGVAAQGAAYREAANESPGMHGEFVDLVIKGRPRRIA